jgi:hypothetical protein
LTVVFSYFVDKTQILFDMKTLCIAFLLVFHAIGCSNGSGDYAESADYTATEAKAEAMDAREEPDMEESTTGANKKVIRTANLRMEVKDHQQATAQIKSMIDRFDAEIYREDERQYGSQIEHQMTIKVAPGRLDSLMAELEAIANFVDSRSVNVEDVTRRYIDLEARLKAKRAVIARYEALLAKANTVQEILTIEENLRKVVEEVESVEGQLKYLQHQVSLSTLNLTYYERTATTEVRTRTFWSRLGDSFARGWRFSKDLVLGIVSIWPLLILLIAGIWLFRRWRRKKTSS